MTKEEHYTVQDRILRHSKLLTYAFVQMNPNLLHKGQSTTVLQQSALVGSVHKRRVSSTAGNGMDESLPSKESERIRSTTLAAYHCSIHSEPSTMFSFNMEWILQKRMGREYDEPTVLHDRVLYSTALHPLPGPMCAKQPLSCAEGKHDDHN